MDAHAAIAGQTRVTRRRLPTSVLPYWFDHSRDDRHGGFLLPDDVVRGVLRRAGRRLLRGPLPAAAHKQLVTQARLVWLFSHAHVHGLDDGRYLDAARRGYGFLVEHFLDRHHGGYAWMTDTAGAVTNPVNHLYGLAFTVYAFVEHARATGTAAPLERALDLQQAVDLHLRDDVRGGWREHADGDWSAVADDDPRILVPFPGRRSGNCVLHWMEALTELAADTGDAGARASLLEALDRCREVLYPADPAATLEPCLPDWTVDAAQREPVSYGHNVEFAWLMVRAQTALGDAPDWDRFHRYLDHALRNGYDEDRGGMFTFGDGDGPASHRHKVSWVQCEAANALLVALTESPEVFDRTGYQRALAGILRFTERHLTDPRDGVLLESAQEDGRRRWPRKSGEWKVGYHEVRTAVMLSEAALDLGP